MESNIINNRDEIEIDLKQIMFVLFNKILFIILSGIIVGAIAFLISQYLLVPKYVSTAKLYIINRQTEGVITSQDLTSSSQLTQDYKELIVSRIVIEKVISDLDLPYKYEQFKGKLSVDTPVDTRILAITIKDKDPYTAKKIADKMADVSVDTIGSVMESERANIIDYGNLPLRPVSPNIFRNTVAGVGIGVILSITIILFIFFIDDSIKSEDDIERYLGISTLGVIPIQDDETDKRKHKFKQNKKRKK